MTLGLRAQTVMYLVNVLKKFPAVSKVDFVVGAPRLKLEAEPELFLLGELGRETKMEVEVHAWVGLWDEVGILEEVRGGWEMLSSCYLGLRLGLSYFQVK